MIGPLLVLLLVVAVVGFAAYMLTTYVPMHPAFKSVIIFIAVIVVVIVALRAFGWVDFGMAQAPRVRL